MVTIDENTKAKIEQMMDSDGKIAITEDMPDDLKSCLKYINDNNINIFAQNPEAYVEDYEADPFAPGYEDENTNDDTPVETDDVEDEEELDADDTVDDSAVNDLDNVF